MPDWKDLVAHVRSSYNITEERDDVLKMHFALAIGRTQMVVVTHHKLMCGTVPPTTLREVDWAQIVAPISTMDEKLLPKLVRAAGTKVCGGIGSNGDLVTYQHAFPLKNFDDDEFDAALLQVLAIADELATDIISGDRL